MRSYAVYSYKDFGNALELGGPVVLFVLVLVGGFMLVPSSDTFDLTVRVYRLDDGKVPINSGTVSVDLDNNRRRESIDQDGEANFRGVPHRFWGAVIVVGAQVEGYRTEFKDVTVSGRVVELLIQKVESKSRLRGAVIPAPTGNKNVSLILDGGRGEGRADALGRFDFPVQANDGQQIRLKVYVDGRLAYDDYQTVPGPISIQLE